MVDKLARALREFGKIGRDFCGKHIESQRVDHDDEHVVQRFSGRALQLRKRIVETLLIGVNRAVEKLMRARLA